MTEIDVPLVPQTYLYGLQYDSLPTDARMDRKLNEDGSETRVMWQWDQDVDYVRMLRDSPAPIGAIKGSKKVVRREIGPLEVIE